MCYYLGEKKNMLKGFSKRKLFFIIVGCTGTFLLILLYGYPRFSLQQKEILQEKLVHVPVIQSTNPFISTTAITSNHIANVSEIAGQPKPWYMAGGTRYPGSYNSNDPPKLFGNQADGHRILEQLMYVPESYQGNSSVKLILAYDGEDILGVNFGTSAFQGCPVSRCYVTRQNSKASDADAVIFKDRSSFPRRDRSIKQVWILFLQESPLNTRTLKYAAVNWTATYRTDSDIVVPYGQWIYYNPQIRHKKQNVNYAANKTKHVAWFVSNCDDVNGRLSYARNLAKYIPVDIYGSCGSLECSRSETQKCFELLKRDYKFYLAFENSNCRDYITEKVYWNSFGQNVIPIVMGGSVEYYQRALPEGSFIHIDEFESPQDLATFLLDIDKNDNLYNSYFTWRGTGEFLKTYSYFWCRLCALLHAPTIPRYYQDVEKWWRGPGVCKKAACSPRWCLYEMCWPRHCTEASKAERRATCLAYNVIFLISVMLLYFY